MITDYSIESEVNNGGKWLEAARTWIQWNIREGDKLCWDSTKDISIPFNKLTEFAKYVVIVTIKEEREKANKLYGGK